MGTGRPIIGHQVPPPRSPSEFRASVGARWTFRVRRRGTIIAEAPSRRSSDLKETLRRRWAADDASCCRWLRGAEEVPPPRSGGEALQLSSADNQSARTLVAAPGRAVVSFDAIIRALRFSVLKDVTDDDRGGSQPRRGAGPDRWGLTALPPGPAAETNPGVKS